MPLSLVSGYSWVLLVIGVLGLALGIDRTFLAILGWRPLVALVGTVAAAQGLLIGAAVSSPAGLQQYV